MESGKRQPCICSALSATGIATAPPPVPGWAGALVAVYLVGIGTAGDGSGQPSAGSANEG